MNGKALGITGLVLVGAAGIILGVGGGGDLNLTAELVETVKPLEKDMADQHFVTPGGRKVRIVRGTLKVDAEVEDTEVGRSVEAEVSPNSLCTAIFDAVPIEAKDLYKDPMGSKREIPNIPEAKDVMGKASWPVQIGGSCNKTPKKCLWNGMFKGDHCTVLAALPGYVC